MKLLGLDIGTNSVGSAWVDTDAKTIRMGVSVFPAGVEESDTKRRGAPKNQARRAARSQRRSIERRADRKHRIQQFLLERKWMPADPNKRKEWLDRLNPWILRAEALERELSPYEFGRILLHMAQRRGAFGLDIEEDSPPKAKWDPRSEKEDAKKAKEQKQMTDAINRTRIRMKERKAQTFGELMAMELRERRSRVDRTSTSIEVRWAIRNRATPSGEGTYDLCADRKLIWEEFDKLWTTQRSFAGELGMQLTDACRAELDNSEGNDAWRCTGILFGQRRTYWDTGTLGRCDLEPTDMRCPRADMYAQEFLVRETVNNIRIAPPGALRRRSTPQEREAIVRKLEGQKTASMATIYEALGIRGQRKTQYTLSLEADPERGLNTNWFQREIVSGAIGQERWRTMSPDTRESVNRAILKFDPQSPQARQRFQEGCYAWWRLDQKQTDRLVQAWMKRPKIDNRVKYSRRAIENLLPYMREGLTVNEARKAFVEDAPDEATRQERQKRYGFKGRSANRALRRYQRKHPGLLPPAPPMLSNPVVRKAIYEVRDHIQAYMRRFGCKPDRIVVELARDAYLPAKIRNQQLHDNRERERKRKAILEDYNLSQLSKTQQEKAVKRVLLCREQKFTCAYPPCPYCDDPIAQGDTAILERIAADGEGVELDHIIPESRGGDNGLNNLVLCHTSCNRGKGNKTPREWLTDEQFGRLEQRVGHLKKTNPIKWDNMHKEVRDLDGFVASQLTDTAYAARQVAEWLRAVLYDAERDGIRHVFTTKGRYTAWLRRDWRLFPDRGVDRPEERDTRHESQNSIKNRWDHRQHAIDAVAIALTCPERLKRLALAIERWELAKAGGRAAPEREALNPPWADFDSFRGQVLEQRQQVIVSHRPQRRRIAGQLHKDEHFGAIAGDPEHFTKRIFAAELKANHLRVPKGWDEFRVRLQSAKSPAEKRSIRKQMLALDDVRPMKPGIVRDRWFREELRECLRRNHFDPDLLAKDGQSAKKYRDWVKEHGLIPQSGVPVRRITLLRTLNRPVAIDRQRFNTVTGGMENDIDPRSETDSRYRRRRLRIYESQNNHHIEIRENRKGKWVANVVTNYDAVRRVRPSKTSGGQPRPAVDRGDTKQGRFVMSLSIGEMVRMRHPSTNKPGHFVVFKIDPTTQIHFTSHWDAGRAGASEGAPAREDIPLYPGDLQSLGVAPCAHAEKIWVGPLGDVKPMVKD